MLYRIGPETYHASYSVHVMQGDKPDVNFDWIKFAGMDRTTEAAAKVAFPFSLSRKKYLIIFYSFCLGAPILLRLFPR